VVGEERMMVQGSWDKTEIPMEGIKLEQRRKFPEKKKRIPFPKGEGESKYKGARCPLHLNMALNVVFDAFLSFSVSSKMCPMSLLCFITLEN
jgi:hypothetical protein